MQWIFVLCGRMFLLSLIATYQVCTVSLKAGLYTYNASGADDPHRRLFCHVVTQCLWAAAHRRCSASRERRKWA
jgi:hypothetical protein